MARSEFKDYSQSVKAVFENRIILNNQKIVDQIHLTSLINTPFRTGALRNTVQKYSNGHDAFITWSMNYAAYQERGSNPDGSRPVRHYTTPGTGPWYARGAVETEMKKLGTYWLNSAQSVPQNRLY